MAHIIMCRACGQRFDTEKEEWVLPAKNQYYHKKCYEEWVNKKDELSSVMSDSEWFESLKYYLGHIVKAPIDYKKLTSQWNNFLKQKKTAKGIYFSIRYFYDVAKGDKEKSQGGIGIVSAIYQDSCNYWTERFERDNSIIEKIERQAKEQLAQQKIVIVQTKKKETRKKAISLEDI